MPTKVEEQRQHKDPYEDESAAEDAQRAAESREEEELEDGPTEKEIVVPPGEIVPPGEAVPTPEEKIADAAEEHRDRIESTGGLPRGKY
jgi:hypothetical protein